MTSKSAAVNTLSSSNPQVRTDLASVPVFVYQASTEAGEKARSILLLHEITGLSPKCMSFAERLARAGFSVYAPVLFGNAGEAGMLSVLRNCWHISINQD